MNKIMFVSSQDHMSGGDAWHCLLHSDAREPGSQVAVVESEQPMSVMDEI